MPATGLPQYPDYTIVRVGQKGSGRYAEGMMVEGTFVLGTTISGSNGGREFHPGFLAAGIRSRAGREGVRRVGVE